MIVCLCPLITGILGSNMQSLKLVAIMFLRTITIRSDGILCDGRTTPALLCGYIEVELSVENL